MKLTTALALILDCCTFFILAFLLLLKDGAGNNVIESLVSNTAVRIAIYFLMGRELYRLLNWRKKYFS